MRPAPLTGADAPAAMPPASADELALAFQDAPPPAHLSGHAAEDWLALGLFWAMVACVFGQFFTRYALNNSLAWTEEIATNLLIAVVFVGAAGCVRRSRHIQVDVLYHYLPDGAGRRLSLAVDLVRVAFFLWATVLFARYMAVVGRERMVTVDLPRWPFYAVVTAGFALMAGRALQVAVGNWRRGYSVLSHPERFEGP